MSTINTILFKSQGAINLCKFIKNVGEVTGTFRHRENRSSSVSVVLRHFILDCC